MFKPNWGMTYLERFSKLFAWSTIAWIKLNNDTILTNDVLNMYKEHGSILLNSLPSSITICLVEASRLGGLLN